MLFFRCWLLCCCCFFRGTRGEVTLCAQVLLRGPLRDSRGSRYSHSLVCISECQWWSFHVGKPAPRVVSPRVQTVSRLCVQTLHLCRGSASPFMPALGLCLLYAPSSPPHSRPSRSLGRAPSLFCFRGNFLTRHRHTLPDTAPDPPIGVPATNIQVLPTKSVASGLSQLRTPTNKLRHRSPRASPPLVPCLATCRTGACTRDFSSSLSAWPLCARASRPSGATASNGCSHRAGRTRKSRRCCRRRRRPRWGTPSSPPPQAHASSAATCRCRRRRRHAP